METGKKTMKAVHGNVTFQCDQCNYKVTKPKNKLPPRKLVSST